MNLSLEQMQGMVARFEERLGEAQLAARPTKQRCKGALTRRGADRCPVRLKRLAPDVMIKYGDDLSDLFVDHPDDLIAVFPYDIWVGYQPPEKTPKIDSVQIAMQQSQWSDEWGSTWAHRDGGVGAHQAAWPIEDWSGLDDYLASGIPDARAPGRLDEARSQIERYGAAKYCVAQFHLPLFDRLNALRGVENTFFDLCTSETEVRRLLDAISDYGMEFIRSLGEIRPDAIMLADDFGTQKALMISPDMWRRFFKPYYARMFDEAHRLGMDVFFHSCGNVFEIIGDFIDIGLDVLDPVQPGALDHEAVAREFGGKLALSGGIDNQNLLVNGTPAEVRDSVRRAVDTLGARFGNAYVVGPSNMVTPDVPLENWRAMFEACHEG